MKQQSNIEFLISMTKDFLDGKIDALEYSLDFPYEVENRYHEMVKEDKLTAEYIFDCLVEDGAYLFDSLSDEAFREKILEHYDFIRRDDGII